MSDEPANGGGFPALPPRPRDGHKGTHGTVLVIGGRLAGGRVMLGAPMLSARAALRAGAGLVVVAVPEPLAATAMAMLPEATAIGMPVDADGAPVASESLARIDAAVPAPDAVVIGPGLGGGEAVQQILVRQLGRDDPVVVDADGLNALAALRDFAGDLRAPAILTPHPGEFDRLASALAIDADPRDPRSRPAAAASLAGRLGCVVILKGRGTIVSDGVDTVVDEDGGPELSVGGTGDVLAGVAGAMVAAGLPLRDAARLAVAIHGRAGQAWSSAHGGASSGLLARELADQIPAVMASMRAG